MKQLQWRNYKRAHVLTALTVVALLFGTFMTRVTRLSEASERVAADQSVVTLNTLLTQVVVSHAVQGTLNELHAYADTNPMRLVEAQLGVVAENYVGEYAKADIARVPPGSWFFDVEARELVYAYRNRPAQLRLRLALNFFDSDANDVFDPGTDRVTGLHLQRLMIEGRSS